MIIEGRRKEEGSWMDVWMVFYGELENRKTTLSLSLFVYCFRFPLSADANVQQQQQLPLINGTPPSHAETKKKKKKTLERETMSQLYGFQSCRENQKKNKK
jgi:hypothetical protein